MRDTIGKKIAAMSLQEKARQLTQLNAVYVQPSTQAKVTGASSPLGLEAQDVYGIGSVLNFTDADEAIAAQTTYLERSESKIPLVFMMDVIHGYRTIFPIPLAMGCTFDEALVEACAEMSAIEATYSGVSVTFSPMVDLVRDARWGRVMESTGEDHFLNGEMGKAFIRGYHKGGLACCVKHFAGYGAPEAGREYNTTDISPRNLKEYYLPAYKACLEENPEMVMTSFNLLNGIPVNADKALLVDTLRDEWGFDGVVISDYAGVIEMLPHGYAPSAKDCARIAANNGVDMEMMSATYIHHLPQLVEEGAVSPKQVDTMLRRVLELKEKLGLFENPFHKANAKKAGEVCLSERHRALAKTAAEKAAVLLKNDGVLPLCETTEIALVGPFAEEKNLLGAWACAGKAEDVTDVRTAVERLLQRKVCTAKGCDASILAMDESGVEQAVLAAANAEVIVACIGEPAAYSGEAAARAKLELPKPQLTLLKALKALGKPVVVVLFGGRPQVLTEAEAFADAILCVWQPGTEGGNAIANLLYGRANPSGKLTMSFPRTTGQCPVYYNAFATGKPKALDTLEGSGYNSSYRDELNAPLYPFGYGLSYTKFEINDVCLSKTEFCRGDTITASVTVKNVGERDGEEVVQLYIRDLFASVVRPVKELKGYRKILLAAGETKRVSFEIDEELLKFYAADGTWRAEAGEFEIMIGNNSVDVLKARLTLKI